MTAKKPVTKGEVNNPDNFLLPRLKAKGFGPWLENAFADIVCENERNIHEIIDALIAKRKQASGKGKSGGGGRKAAAGGAAGGAHSSSGALKLSPSLAEVKKTGVTTHGTTRSMIEDIDARVDSATTIQQLFEDAAKQCKESVDKIIATCKKNKTPFFDSNFYFDDKNNMFPEGSPSDCTVTAPENAVRLTELFPRAPLFASGISQDDILQGGVGDCFLIGAISALASANPHNIERLFVAQNVQYGVYGVCFFKCGGWEWVIVDDFVPVEKFRSGDMFPLYGSCGEQDELWPMILEKAYAKMHYNWDIIDGGWAKEALVDLTGGLATTFDLYGKHKDMTFKSFMEHVVDRYTVLGCAVGDHIGSEEGGAAGSSGEESALFGLYHGHQYSVVGAAETPDGKGFIRVRNPWGNDAEWTGPYADNAIEWRNNPKHKAALKPEFKDDGAFWMTWDDFHTYFTSVDVVRTFPPDYKLLSKFEKASSQRVPSNTYLLQVCDARTKLCITFSQDDPKMKYGGKKSHELQYKPYNTLKFTVFQLRELPSEYDELETCVYQRKQSESMRERQVFYQDEFEPGIYCVIPKMSPAKDTGMFLRVIGPSDADYALWRFDEGEESKLVVGKCPNVQGVGVEEAAKVVADPRQTKTPGKRGGGGEGGKSSTTPSSAVKEQHADPGSTSSPHRPTATELRLQQELDEALAYTATLQKLITAQKEQIDILHAQRSKTPTLTDKVPALERLGIHNDKQFTSIVKQVFDEVGEGRQGLNREEALTAFRLIVTVGAGMDQVFEDAFSKQQRTTSDEEEVDMEDFKGLCSDVIHTWNVLK